MPELKLPFGPPFDVRQRHPDWQKRLAALGNEELQGKAFQPTNVPPRALPAIIDAPSVPVVSPFETDTPVRRGVYADTEVLYLAIRSKGGSEVLDVE